MELTVFQERYNKLPSLLDNDYKAEIEREKLMSKFQVLETPPMFPHACMGCGGGSKDRNYVDFGVSIDYYGAVYFCTRCMAEICGILIKMGIIQAPVAESKAIDEDYKVDLEDIKAILSSTQDSITEFLNRKVQNDIAAADDNYSDIINHELDSGVSTDTTETKPTSKRSTRTKSGTTKSDSSSGREDISSLTELLGKTT